MLVRLALACILFSCVALPQSTEDPAVTYARRIIAAAKPYRPAAGYVPDSNTAVAIATAVLIPIYGKAKIDAERPWHTGLKNGVWTVVGTFHGNGLGGEGIVQIDKKTAAIVYLGHTM
jgi:hypothetical protein